MPREWGSVGIHGGDQWLPRDEGHWVSRLGSLGTQGGGQWVPGIGSVGAWRRVRMCPRMGGHWVPRLVSLGTWDGVRGCPGWGQSVPGGSGGARDRAQGSPQAEVHPPTLTCSSSCSPIQVLSLSLCLEM